MARSAGRHKQTSLSADTSLVGMSKSSTTAMFVLFVTVPTNRADPKMKRAMFAPLFNKEVKARSPMAEAARRDVWDSKFLSQARSPLGQHRTDSPRASSLRDSAFT